MAASSWVPPAPAAPPLPLAPDAPDVPPPPPPPPPPPLPAAPPLPPEPTSTTAPSASAAVSRDASSPAMPPDPPALAPAFPAAPSLGHGLRPSQPHVRCSSVHVLSVAPHPAAVMTVNVAPTPRMNLQVFTAEGFLIRKSPSPAHRAGRRLRLARCELSRSSWASSLSARRERWSAWSSRTCWPPFRPRWQYGWRRCAARAHPLVCYTPGWGSRSCHLYGTPN